MPGTTMKNWGREGVYLTSLHSKTSTSLFHFNQLFSQICMGFLFQSGFRTTSGLPCPHQSIRGSFPTLLMRVEGSQRSCEGTDCSHGGQERGSPGAIPGWCLEELFAQEGQRKLQPGLVWSELSQSRSSQDFQWHPLPRRGGEGCLKIHCSEFHINA